METRSLGRLAGMLVGVGLIGCGAVDPIETDFDAYVHYYDVMAPDVAPVCTDGESRCVANTFEICLGGQWYEVKECVQTCDPVNGCPEDFPEDAESFIWIANTNEGTLSKVDTKTAVEVARYRTCAQGAMCDPSRTSVNLHGDAVVTNRNVTPSSVTKFAASIDDCIDRDGSENIETSTGPTDVLPWGEDECMLWHTELPNPLQFPDGTHGARATAWDGEEDPDTGAGGSVWVGTCSFSDVGGLTVYQLDGDTGTIVEELGVQGVSCAYGGAVDGSGRFWILDWLTVMVPTPSVMLVGIDMLTHTYEAVPVDCGYGITVDGQGRVWTGGMNMMGGPLMNCVNRYDPSTGVVDVVGIGDAEFLRGIAVGVGKSAGSVWAADTPGALYQIDATSMQVVDRYEFGYGFEMIGAAVDYEGYVWTVGMMQNATFKYDPETGTHEVVPIGDGPYTYSDMTGVQLKNVIIVR